MSDNQQTDADGGSGRKTQKKKRRKGKRLVLPRIKTPKREKRGGGGCISNKLDYSCAESPTSDPNSPHFTFASLRTLIENSDYFFNDCNTHF
ncbi:hypothetical protein Hanom_Chr03g00208661 [Helianthus anomalus]